MKVYVYFLVKSFSRVAHRSQLSHRVSNINIKTGDVKCDRVDLLLADNVHVASWGDVNIHDETVKMTLAIPSSTLRKMLGLSRLDHDFYLKTPILGSVGRLQVDFRVAGKCIAQLTPATDGQLSSCSHLSSSRQTRRQVPVRFLWVSFHGIPEARELKL